MSKISYRIVLQPNSTFAVEIFGPDRRRSGAAGFTTEAAAQAWVNEKKRLAKADEKSESLDTISYARQKT
jgi:hypothetical protein